MRLRSIISNLNAWQTLKDSKPYMISELEEVIAEATADSFNARIGYHESREKFRDKLVSLGWVRPELRIRSPNSSISMVCSIDYIKNDIGLELFVAKRQYLESFLFFQLQALVRANIFLIPVIILPMEYMRKDCRPGTTYFESIKTMLTDFYGGSIKYPFLIAGVSNEEGQNSEPDVLELNTELDTYLIERLGMTLNEMILMWESDNYDFKEAIPNNFGKSACGFANMSRGGLFIFGIDDSGVVVGMNDNEWDEYQTKLTNIVVSTCFPCPKFRLLKFDTDSPEKKIFIFDVQELDRKPCLYKSERVYIRKGTTACIASSEDIRRMILK